MFKKVLLFVLAVVMLQGVCFAYEQYIYKNDDDYAFCAIHQELEWYIIKDSVEIGYNEDGMPIVTVDVLTVNCKNKTSEIETHEFLYDEENQKMYHCHEDGEKFYLRDRGSWASTGRYYYVGRTAYYVAFGERFYQ